MWTHTLQVVDEARASLAELAPDRPRQLAVMLGALCHDLGKPTTTRFEDGRIRSRGHEEAGLPPDGGAPRPLERPHAARLRRARRRCWRSSRSTSSPASSTTTASACPTARSGASRAKCEPDLLYRVARADCLGRRPGAFEPVAMEWFRERVQKLDVARARRPSRC